MKNKKITVFAFLFGFAIFIGIFITFLAKPQRLKLNGGLGAIAKENRIKLKINDFFKNILPVRRENEQQEQKKN